MSIQTAFTKDTGLPASALPPGPGYIIDQAGRIVVPQTGGATKEFYPSTTGGKLDLFGISIPQRGETAPVASREDTPTPQGIISQNLAALQKQFGDQVQQLKQRASGPKDFNPALAKLQAEYDQTKAGIMTKKTELDSMQSMVDSGLINPEAGQEASWRMVVPDEVAVAMFPRQRAEPRGRMTPGEITALSKSFKTAIKPARTDSSWWPGQTYSPEALKQAYFNQRELLGYNDQMNSSEQRAFDLAWDKTVGENKASKKAWGQTMQDPEVFGSRTYGNQLQQVAAKKMGVSPFAQSVAAQAPQAIGRIKVKAPGGIVGTIPASQQNEAIASGYEVVQ